MRRLDAQRLALTLMGQHGLLPEWSFSFDGAKSRFGLCLWQKRSISLSGPMTDINDEAEVRDTILHEIAHALSITRYGLRSGSGHGTTWQHVCREIGASPVRCVGANVKQPPMKYLAICSGCGEEHWMARVTKRAGRIPAYFCAKCPRFTRPLYFVEPHSPARIEESRAKAQLLAHTVARGYKVHFQDECDAEYDVAEGKEIK